MTGQQPAMSGAGFLVVGTLCFGLLMTLGTVCALVLRGMTVPSELQVIIGGLLTGVPALLAKSYHDKKKAGDPTEPAAVTVVNNGEPVVVEQAPVVPADVP